MAIPFFLKWAVKIIAIYYITERENFRVNLTQFFCAHLLFYTNALLAVLRISDPNAGRCGGDAERVGTKKQINGNGKHIVKGSGSKVIKISVWPIGRICVAAMRRDICTGIYSAAQRDHLYGLAAGRRNQAVFHFGGCCLECVQPVHNT